MRALVKYIGTDTGQEFSAESFPWQGHEGELLDLFPYDVRFSMSAIRSRPPNLWRYLEALPFDADEPSWREVSMGEGFTPLLPLDPANPRLLVKVDYQMPTLSFKDRGAVVLIAKAKSLGVKKVIQDSSGNAGTSVAAYAARAGMSCTIFVRESTSSMKVAQIRAHGADVVAVSGTREDTANAAKRAADAPGVFYASHVYNPLFYQGTKTYAFEIWEQLGKAPDVLIVPVGNGTLVLGAYYGFTELYEAGLIERVPRIIAVQSERCDPLYQAWIKGKSSAEPVKNTGTIAEGIAVAAPARHKQILAAVAATRGSIVSVGEKRIVPAQAYLASRGFYVEPTTAINYAALSVCQDFISSQETVVIPLCGAGLKSAS
jgi:threonine synthase